MSKYKAIDANNNSLPFFLIYVRMLADILVIYDSVTEKMAKENNKKIIKICEKAR